MFSAQSVMDPRAPQTQPNEFCSNAERCLRRETLETDLENKMSTRPPGVSGAFSSKHI